MPCSSKCARRLPGSASPVTRAFRRLARSAPVSRPFSSRIFRNEGVPAYPWGRRSAIAATWISVWPTPGGTTAHASAARAGGEPRGLYPCEPPGERWSPPPPLFEVGGQRREERRFPLRRVSRFQEVVVSHEVVGVR